MKHDNRFLNVRNRIEYFSSLFIAFNGKAYPHLPEYKGMFVDDNLEFDSNYESANLMAVFKVKRN